MVFRGKDIKNFTESDLKEMIRDRESESLEIEFKSTMYTAKRSDKIEMLKDISAMANAYGGLIFLGIGEDNHRADSINGISNATDYQSTILKSCRSNLDQPIDGLEVHPIPVEKGLHVLAIVIPDSRNKPHAVNYKGHMRFYKRMGTDNQPLSTLEIRDMVLFEEYARDKVERFMEKRKTILRRKFSQNQPNLVLSILPNRFAEPSLSLSNDVADKLFSDPQTRIDYSVSRQEYTMNGIRALKFVNGESKTPSVSYEIFDNGYLEVVLNARQLYIPDFGVGYRPNDLLRVTYNGAKLLLTLSSIFTLPSKYTFILWATSTVELAIVETRELGDWDRFGKPILFDEPEFEISHTVNDLDGTPDELIYPLFQKLYRSFNMSFVRYYNDGKLSLKGKQIIA